MSVAALQLLLPTLAAAAARAAPASLLPRPLLSNVQNGASFSAVAYLHASHRSPLWTGVETGATQTGFAQTGCAQTSRIAMGRERAGSGHLAFRKSFGVSLLRPLSPTRGGSPVACAAALRGGGGQAVQEMAQDGTYTDPPDTDLAGTTLASSSGQKDGSLEKDGGSSSKKSATFRDWQMLFRLSAVDWPFLTLALASLILAATGEVMIPQMQSATLNMLLLGRADALRSSLTKLVVVGLFTAVATGIRGYLFWLSGARLVARLRDSLFSSLLRKPQSFHDTRSAGELSSRLASDCIKLGDVLSLNVNIVLRQVVQTIGGMSAVYRLDPRLAAILGVGVLARSLLSSYYGTFSRSISNAQQTALAEASTVAQQCLLLIQTIKAYGTQAFEARRYRREVMHLRSLQGRQGVGYGIIRVITGSLDVLQLAAVLWLGSNLVASGSLPTSALTSLVLYTGFVSSASSDIGDQWARVQARLVPAGFDGFAALRGGAGEALGASSAVFALLDDDSGADAAASDHTAANASVQSALLPDCGLAFHNVSFEYPSRSIRVLSNVNLQVRRGERLAVVGGSGSGKSTMLKLALNFYAPTSGTVSLDGRDVQALSESEIRNLVTWVPQEPPLFPVSIRENIAYGTSETTSREDVERAARAANCHSFISAMPQGYETICGQGGAALSGGQRQRIAIARALLRDPAVLILDEATSALDPESARLVEATMITQSASRAVVLTTHKLEQAKSCDRIVVMDGGRVAEEGTHVQLLQAKGEYYRLLQQAEAPRDE